MEVLFGIETFPDSRTIPDGWVGTISRHDVQLLPWSTGFDGKKLNAFYFCSRASRMKTIRVDRAGFKGANWAVAQGPPQIRGLHKKR